MPSDNMPTPAEEAARRLSDASTCPSFAPQEGWHPIISAPTDGTPIIVQTRCGAIFKAEASDGVCEEGWAWIASDEGVHPRCWTNGVCWSENEDYEPSDPPILWIPAPPAPGDVIP